MKKIVPIGTEYFAKLRENYYFVDKTTFLIEFFRAHSDVTLITRPRRFGKTLLLSMIQQFLDIEDAEEHQKFFEGLKVMDDPVAMAEQGTRPVVFLTMKGWTGDTWESMQRNIAWYLADLYGNFMFLQKDKMSPQDAEAFDQILRGKATMEVFSKAFPLLCKLLECHYGKKVVLLIDEYDAPIQCTWTHRYYKDAIGFYRDLFSNALKTNPALDFAILTGVLRIAKESIFSGLNNLHVSSVITGGYSTACGYTREEVAKMARDFDHEDKLEEIASWYDGYHFHGVEIYNPWSVNNYFSAGCKARKYWVRTSGNQILQTMLKQLDPKRTRQLKTLMDGHTIRTRLEDSFIYQDIERHRANLYSVLLATGYLKCVGNVDEDDEEKYDLSIPNKEIWRVFRDEILNYLSSSEDQTILEDLLEAMQDGDTEYFQECLQTVLRDMVSYHDAAQPESFYHGLMLGLPVWLESRYRIRSNRESGYGRFDLAFFPKRPALPGLVMEFKAVEKEEDLAQGAEDACRQIEGKAYAADLEAEGVQDIWKYGIAFCGKQVLVKRADDGV
ncbi:AAA family ATPase [uncultured Selenomonas sp.]|uniref:AAA family ATPase n=1 Tax=uncultured Selenomonas sp. TaxID=159275 RepID=UPI0025DDEC54|nr:AAA family ATPase [uncultured Selenomonas sp.]